MNQKLLIVLLCLFTLATTNSCKTDDGGKAIEITSGQQNQTVHADSDKGSGGVTFKTAGAWTSTVTEGGGTRSEETDGETRAAALWISISPSSGSSAGSYTIEISLEDNYTGADRTATITITSGGESITIVVTQKGTTESGEQPVRDVAVTGVSLNKTSTALTVGGTETLTATVIPANATNQNVTWSSSDNAVATIDGDGRITAMAPGTASIVVSTADGGKTAICNVTVNAASVAVTSVSLNKSSTTMTVGDKETLTATIIPANATNRNVTWVSSDPSVVGVENGEITAIAPGTASIIISTADGGKTAICNVAVNAAAVAVTGVELNKASLSLVEGANETLIATVVPTGATNKNVTWKSSAAAIATVDANGKVTAVKAGMATITVTTADGAKTADCAVTVTAKTPDEVKVTKIDITPAGAVFVEAGKTTALSATVSPTNATNKAVTWNSSNATIATVNASTGVVTGTGAGTVTITATANDGSGVSQSKTVTVTAAVVAVTGVTINSQTLSLVEGTNATLIATVAPATATNKNVSWTSNNTAVATVDASGKVTAVKAGSATITATTADGAKTAVCTVTVTAKTVAVTGVGLNKSTLSLVEETNETLTATVAPANATNKRVSWTSTNNAIATVDANGKVTAVKAGTTTITVTTADGAKTAACAVTVTAKTPDEVKVRQIDITPAVAVSVEAGKTITLSATVSPTNATNKAVTWSSGNTVRATVDASTGVVTGVSAGTVTITATANDGSGVTQTKEVTVTPAVVSVTGVSLNKSATSLVVGGTETLAATVAPANATNKNVTWTSGDSSVATVDTNGKITAVEVGTTVVIVSTQDGGKTATCTVTVTSDVIAEGMMGPLSWVLTTNETLIISGNGTMPDYFNTNSPLYPYRDKIRIIIIENGTTHIGDYAFESCYVQNVTIPNSVISIGRRAFNTCTSLKSVTIPRNVTSLHNSAFDNCHSLEHIDVAIDNQSYTSEDGIVFNKGKTVLIICPSGKEGNYTIPNSVTSIDDHAFSSNDLTNITIPHSVLNLGYQAFFYGRYLTSVVIGSGITNIESSVFQGCSNLTTVTIMATVPPTLSNTENFDASGDTLYVPKDSLAAYKSNAAWSAAFTNIVEQSGGQNPPVGPGGGAEDWGNGGEIEL